MSEKSINNICGYAGMVLVFIPILKAIPIPIPWFQAIISFIDPVVTTVAGTTGCGLLMATDKLIGKK